MSNYFIGARHATPDSIVGNQYRNRSQIESPFDGRVFNRVIVTVPLRHAYNYESLVREVR